MDTEHRVALLIPPRAPHCMRLTFAVEPGSITDFMHRAGVKGDPVVAHLPQFGFTVVSGLDGGRHNDRAMRAFRALTGQSMILSGAVLVNHLTVDQMYVVLRAGMAQLPGGSDVPTPVRGEAVARAALGAEPISGGDGGE